MDNNNSDGDEDILMILFIGCFIVFIVALGFFVWNSVKTPSPGPASSDTGGATGGSPGPASSGPGPQSFTQLQNLPPPSDDILTNIMEEIPNMIKLVGIQLAITAALRPSATWDVLSKGATKLQALGSRLRASPVFESKVSIARDTVSESRVASSSIAAKILRGEITALDAARMGARFARTLGQKMGLVGETAASRAAARAEIEAATAATSAAARTGALAALDTISAALAPAAAVYDVFSIVGLVLDSKNWGGWAEYADTQSLINAQKQSEIEQMNEMFINNGVRYPYIVGPLDAYQQQDPDVYQADLQYRMLDLLLNYSDAAGNPHPILHNIIAELYNRRQLAGNTATIGEDFETVLNELSPSAFTALAELAIDALCTARGGVSFDQGIPGWGKACTYSTPTQCFANSVWTFGQGVATPPPPIGSSPAPSPSPGTNDGEWNGAYYEWRNPDYFAAQDIRLVNDATIHHIQNVPAAGACILQSPGWHLACNKKICVDGGQWSGNGGCAYNQYDRTRGVCYNDAPGMCDMYAVDQKSDGPTYLGRQFPTCYESESKQAAEAAAGGYSLYRATNSCVNYHYGNSAGIGPCGNGFNYRPVSGWNPRNNSSDTMMIVQSDENGAAPTGVCAGAASYISGQPPC